MTRHHEIPLPASPFTAFPFRAVREDATIRFEAISATHRVENGLRYGILLLIGAGLVAFYVGIAVWLVRDGNSPPWWFHVLMAGLAVLIFGAVANQVRFADRLAVTTLSRRGDGLIEVRYRWRNGTEQVHRFTEPSRLIVLLRHDDSAETVSWHDVSEDGSAPRKEKFRDEVQIDLYFVGTAAAPWVPILRQRWRALVPVMQCYFREPAYKDNRYAAVEAARPLARAVQECLELAVEFRVAGGPLLERMEPWDLARAR